MDLDKEEGYGIGTNRAETDNAGSMRAQADLLERYMILAGERLQDLPSWELVFGRKAPLEVEIGFGGGESLAWHAPRAPRSDFVGIELPMACFSHAVRRLSKVGVDNVRLVRGDARFLLRELFPAASVDRVLMQFPMPWPKQKHAKHRVITPGFAATLGDVLVRGGQFELVTDQGWLCEEARRRMKENGAFDVEAIEVDPERDFRTRYESKWLAEGRSVFRLQSRLAHPRPSERNCTPEPMRIAHLASPPAAATLNALVGQSFREGESRVEIKRVFQAEDGWLLQVSAADGSFCQHFFLRIEVKADQRVLLRVHEHPQPFHTEAVQFTLRELEHQLG